MCGRFTQASPKKKIVEGFQIREFSENSDDVLWAPRYNIAPTQPVLAITMSQDTSGRQLRRFKWGLVPSWAKDASIGNKLINARSETAATKPSFREAFKRRRCLIVADGFYEWQKLGSAKQPHYIYMADAEPFAMAGLWERWYDPDGQSLATCTILTTEANDMMRPIHHRMPVILDHGDYDEWLDTKPSSDGVQHLMKPCPSEVMDSRAVSKLVNNPRNDSVECLETVS